jgi:type II secretion system protein I
LRTRITNKPRAGFTLIEILVAFAILGLAAGAVLSVFSSSPGRISRAENRRMALLEAQSILDLVGNERPIEEGQWQGDLAIESTNASITSIQVVPPTKDHDVLQLNERVTVSARLGALPAIVRQIEQRIPYVFIDTLSVTAPESSPKDRQVQVTVTSDFHAYMLPGLP